ncbi:transcriptional regulator [Eisenbergiella tayi]|uniref:Transcriptional regulator n=1 Tax=Eisenbergiella tayi TaxID=1432052 RepID=A0A1E3UEA3_9FIRM|nr:helix-turn-helix transcriptional regulator [Eisenbergiella tayi]ODR47475.1 transcriptional regulator [Eisenbergiella tayi]
MFSENLKQIRKEKGISQEELAARLNVVRQTISKWEKGLSVPDAELLIKLSEILETSVGTLLGDTIEAAADKNVISQQLEQLNAQLAEKSRRSRRIWRTAAIVFIVLAVLSVLLYAGGIATFHSFSEM